LLAALADRIDVLYLQQGGTWHSLLRWFATATVEAGPVVRVVSHPKLVRHKLFRELVSPDVGAPIVALEVRELETAANPVLESRPVELTSPPHSPPADIRSLESLVESADDYLIHFTRRCDGPWPDQPWDDYCDELLDERPERDRSPLAVLRQILLRQRILSSRRAIRGNYRVVCLADVRLASLAGRRVWRRHRRRWDFEPYGLAFRREALQALGARPVIYGDEATWRSLAEVDRPYFQKSLEIDPDESTVWNRAPGVDSPAATIDWRVEQEWRVVGNVELAAFSINDLLVFVPNRQAARVIAACSRLPIVVLQESGSR
jgi:hypothetical protein